MTGPRARVTALLLLSLSCERSPQKGPEPSQDPPSPARVELVTGEGEITVEREGKEQPAPKALSKGDVVVTGPKSTAVLRLGDGRTVLVQPNARFRLKESTGDIVIEIEHGAILSRTKADADPHVVLTILTPFGISRVPAGGEASVAVTEKGAVIEVAIGEITFVGKDGLERRAKAGEKLEISLGTIQIVRRGEPIERPPDAGPSDAATADAEQSSPGFDAGPAAPDAGRVVHLEPVVIVLSAERGTALIRRAGEKKFEAVARKPATLAPGTAYRIAQGGRATLSAGGVRVRLSPGATGTVGKAYREAGLERMELALDSGESQILFAAGDREVAVSSGGVSVTLKSEEETAVVVSKSAHGPRVEVQTGKVEVSSPRGTHEARSGEIAEVSKDRIATAARPRAPLSLMSGGTVNVNSSTDPLREVALCWTDTRKPGRAEVATDAGFKDLLLAGRVTGPCVNVAPPSSGDLYWRVLGDDGATAVQRGHARFLKEAGRGADLSHPRSEVAETGLKATVYFQSALPAVTFTFAATEGAKHYRLRVYRADDLAAPVVEQTSDEARCTVKAGELAEGVYVWHASPLDAGGAELSGGRMNHLEISYDNSVTKLAIERPRPGEPAADEVAVQGVAPLGSKLFVNGLPASLDTKGRFATAVPRAETVVFRLISGDGTESYWVRTLGKGR
jgi:hypothetical protein